MNIITDKKDNSVIFISNKILEEDIYYYPQENNFIYFKKEFTNNYILNEVPDYIELYKYCYTDENGFYENPNYEEPNKYGINNELLQQIQDDILADLINMGVI